MMKAAVFFGALLLATVASADVCLDLGGVVYVGKNVSFPANGNCRPWHGFVQGGMLCPGGEAARSSGTLCASNGGFNYTFSIISTCLTDDTYSSFLYIDAGSIERSFPYQGVDRFSVADTGWGSGASTVFDAATVSCATAMGSADVWMPWY